MRVVSPEDVYRAEHELIHDAFSEFIGTNSTKSGEDLQYLWGVHEMAHKLAEYAKENM